MLGISSNISQIPYRVIYPTIKGLKAFFSFGASDKALDVVGKGHSSFDGTNDYITTENPDFTNTEDFTVALWIKTTDSSKQGPLIGVPTDGSGGYWAVKIKSSGRVSMTFTDGTNSINNLDSGTSWNDGKWHHIAYTVSRIDGCKHYRYEEGELTQSRGSTSVTGDLSSTSSLYIGANNGTGNQDSFFNGDIKNAAIWNRVLSSDEINSIMYKEYSELSVSELTDLKMWLPLDSDSDTAYSNAHSSSYNGTNSGSTLVTDTYGLNSPIKPRAFDNSPEVEAEYVGSGSASMDGAADTITTVASSSIITGTNVSYTFWAKTNDTDRTYLIANQKGAGSTNMSLSINANGGTETAGVITAFTWNGLSHDNVVYDGNVDDHKWHHYAFTTSSSAQKLYLDGIEVASGTNTFTNAASSDLMTIGSLNNADYWLNGNIAQVGVWSRVLKKSDVNNIKNMSYEDFGNTETNGLVSYWAMDANYLEDSTEEATTTSWSSGDFMTSAYQEKTFSGALTSGAVYLLEIQTPNYVSGTYKINQAGAGEGTDSGYPRSTGFTHIFRSSSSSIQLKASNLGGVDSDFIISLKKLKVEDKHGSNHGGLY